MQTTDRPLAVIMVVQDLQRDGDIVIAIGFYLNRFQLRKSPLG